MIVGEPTGISLKAWLGDDTALAGAAAWSVTQDEEENAYHFHTDYLHHAFHVFQVEKGRMPLFYGIGVGVETEEETRFNARIPLGISYMFETAPVDIFFQMVPMLDLVPSTDIDFNAGAGVQYYF